MSILCGRKLFQSLRSSTREVNSRILFRQCLATGFLPINNTEIYCEKTGTSSEAILCIPGALGFCRSDFPKQLDHLSNEFTVVSFDPRGYGQSQKEKRQFPLDFYRIDAKDGAEVMKALGFKKYSVLGWSDGGVSAMILAACNQDIIKKLVVWGSNAYVSDTDIQFVEKTRDVNNWSERMRKPLEDVYGKEYFPILWNNWVEGYSRFAEHSSEGDICMSDLKNIHCPTLLVHGAKDAMLPQFHAEYLHANIKDSKLVVWPEGKHNLHMRFYEEFNKLVTNFLRDKPDDTA